MSQKKHLLCFAVLKGKGCSEDLFVKKIDFDKNSGASGGKFCNIHHS